MLTPVVYLTKESELETLLKEKLTEVIISPSKLSRFGHSSIEEVNTLAMKAQSLGIKTFLEWDILMTEDSFKECTEEFNKIELDNFTAIRPQDPGAIYWCLKNTNKKIHLNLETGNHNLRAINSWLDLDRGRIDRVILSIEWSRNQLKELLPKLTCPVEFLGMGRILLFYTPRYLLQAGFSRSESTTQNVNVAHWIEASGQSEESPHKGFPLIENQHGTFMFLPSDHCLLDYSNELEELGLNAIRIDNRFMSNDLFLSALKQLRDPTEELFNQLKDKSEVRLIRGFYNANKSDVLFKKLKNYRIQRKDENYLGQVLEVNKKNYLAIQLKRPDKALSIGDKLRIVTPDGKEKFLEVKFMKAASGQALESAEAEDLIFVNHVGGVSTRSAVYYYER